jgi:DNA-binding response OmpR family regulator
MTCPSAKFVSEALLPNFVRGRWPVSTTVVEHYVSYLRKKLDREGEPSHIRTVRGIGYTFEPPQDRA